MKRIALFLLLFGLSGQAAFAGMPNTAWLNSGRMIGHQQTQRSPSKVSSQELECLARNIYFEGRSEPYEGQLAIAYVTLNRVASGRYPDSICKVVRQGARSGVCQFSWYCQRRNHTPYNRGAWLRAKAAAREALAHPHGDPTGGAIYYHANYVHPFWARVKVRTIKIGRHIYYRDPGHRLPVEDVAAR